MTSLLTINLLRLLFVVFAAYSGAVIGEELFRYRPEESGQIFGLVAGLIFGLILVLTDRLLQGVTLRAFSAATFGLILGLIFATLLRASDILKFQTEEIQWAVGLVLYLTFGYLGMMLAIRSNREEFSLIIPYVRFSRSADLDPPLLVDTNIIIDGRIQDLCTTGFLSPYMIVPRFVLDELQTLADSTDGMKRERGRRGLDNLNVLRDMKDVEVVLHETHETPDGENVDARLIRLSRRIGARLLTNDSNLCRIARLQQVRVMNLNDLANAMRPSVTAGDELDLELVKEGKDDHQAVGYLPDGTMIVVNHAKERIGATVRVKVSGTVQTSAGRLIFADLVGRK